MPADAGIASALVIGADSTIGKALLAQLTRSGVPVSGTSRRASSQWIELDLLEAPDRAALPAASVAFFCAAVTSLAACRKDPATSRRINVEAALALSRRLAAMGTRVIGLSTNLVFDGSIPHAPADASICPQTEYGRQKAEFEAGLLAMGRDACVVRLTKVVSSETPLFAGWVGRLRRGETIAPFSDLVMAPLALDDTAALLVRIARENLSGVVQLSGRDDASYADVAAALAKNIGAPIDLVQPMTSTRADVSLEWVPSHTTLDTTRATRELGWSAPELSNVLSEVWRHDS